MDGDFAGKDLLLAAVGADDELAVGVHVDGCAAACAAARQIEGDVAAQVDAGRLVLVPEGSEALPCEGVERTVKAEVRQRLGQPLGVGGKVHLRALQLEGVPGIAAQNLMGKGIGFGPEGDYKISALSAVLMKMSEGKEGATGFIEDYTYDLTPGQELELASHMLEVPVAFAATKPEIDVIPLGIGGKEDPARLIFDGVTGDGIQVTMVDMGDHFRIICADQR